jgi:peroxiredoxin
VNDVTRWLAGALLSIIASLAWSAGPGDAAPALVLPDAAGRTIDLATYRGQVVYVDFWASWCVPCRESMPLLDTLYKRHRDAGFAVVGINKDVAAADAERFLKRVAVSFPLAADTKDAAAKAFNVKAMPSGYLVDRKGVVRRVHRGFTAETGAALDGEVAALLKEGS